MIKNEFIRVVGSMGKSFINSSQFFYQWKQKAFDVAQIIPSNNDGANNGFAKGFGTFNFDDVKEAIGVSGVDYTDKLNTLNCSKRSSLWMLGTLKKLKSLMC